MGLRKGSPSNHTAALLKSKFTIWRTNNGPSQIWVEPRNLWPQKAPGILECIIGPITNVCVALTILYFPKKFLQALSDQQDSSDVTLVTLYYLHHCQIYCPNAVSLLREHCTLYTVCTPYSQPFLLC